MKAKIINFKQKGKNKKLTLYFLIFLIILINLCTTYTLAKYSSQLIGNASTKIAKPIVEVEGENEKEITVFSPKASYNFCVKNYNNVGEFNEIDMKYNIEIISKSLENLELHLFKGEEEIKLTDYKTEEMTLRKGEEQTDKYHLDITFPEGLEEDMQAQLEIKVNSIQKNN